MSVIFYLVIKFNRRIVYGAARCKSSSVCLKCAKSMSMHCKISVRNCTSPARKGISLYRLARSSPSLGEEPAPHSAPAVDRAAASGSRAPLSPARLCNSGRVSSLSARSGINGKHSPAKLETGGKWAHGSGGAQSRTLGAAPLLRAALCRLFVATCPAVSVAKSDHSCRLSLKMRYGSVDFISPGWEIYVAANH